MPRSSTKEAGLEVVELPVVENKVNFEDKYEDIKRAAYEINEVIRIDPPIHIEGDPALLIKDFNESIRFVSKFDKLSESTMDTIELFRKHSKNVEYYTKIVNKKYNYIKKNFTKGEVKRLVDLINQFYTPPTPIDFRESLPVEYTLNELMINLKFVTKYIKFDKRSLSLLKALGKTFSKKERAYYKKEIKTAFVLGLLYILRPVQEKSNFVFKLILQQAENDDFFLSKVHMMENVLFYVDTMKGVQGPFYTNHFTPERINQGLQQGNLYIPCNHQTFELLENKKTA